MTDQERARRLRAALDRLGLVGAKVEKHAAADAPTVYEAVTRQMVEDLADRQADHGKWIFGIFAAVVAGGLAALVLGAL